MTNDELHEMGVTARRLEREIAKHGEVTYQGFTIRPSQHCEQNLFAVDGVACLFILMYEVVVWIEGAGEEYRRRKHLPDVEQ